MLVKASLLVMASEARTEVTRLTNVYVSIRNSFCPEWSLRFKDYIHSPYSIESLSHDVDFEWVVIRQSFP